MKRGLYVLLVVLLAFGVMGQGTCDSCSTDQICLADTCYDDLDFTVEENGLEVKLIPNIDLSLSAIFGEQPHIAWLFGTDPVGPIFQEVAGVCKKHTDILDTAGTNEEECKTPTHAYPTPGEKTVALVLETVLPDAPPSKTNLVLRAIKTFTLAEPQTCDQSTCAKDELCHANECTSMVNFFWEDDGLDVEFISEIKDDPSLISPDADLYWVFDDGTAMVRLNMDCFYVPNVESPKLDPINLDCKNPPHTYSNPGVYNVLLTVETLVTDPGKGQPIPRTIEITKPVTVTEPPPPQPIPTAFSYPFDEIKDGKILAINGPDLEIKGTPKVVSALIDGGVQFSEKDKAFARIDLSQRTTQAGAATFLPQNIRPWAIYSRIPPRISQVFSTIFKSPFVGRAHAPTCINSFSYAGWISPSDDTKGVIAKADGIFSLVLDGTVKWSVGSGALHDTGVYLPINDWTHIGLVFDKGHMKVYFDGIVMEEVDDGCTGLVGTFTVAENLAVRLDDTHIENRAWFTHEIISLLDKGLRREPLDYVSRWEFDVDASDEAGRHDGIIIGEESSIEVLNPDSTKEEGYLRIPGVTGNYVQVGEVSEVADDSTGESELNPFTS